MAIANPRIHIICGICGCKDMLTYRIDEIERWSEKTQEETLEPSVYISCKNCSSLTDLSELMDEEKKS